MACTPQIKEHVCNRLVLYEANNRKFQVILAVQIEANGQFLNRFCSSFAQ